MRGVNARCALAAAVLGCLLTGSACFAAPAEPVPSPTPVVQTPTETAAERQERLDYAAAEKSYRTFRAEYERVLRAGGAKRPTEVMAATATGTYLATFTDVIRGFKSLGSRHEGRAVIAYVRPAGYEAESILLEVCEDNRSVVTKRTKRKSQRGGLLVARIEVRRINDNWKVASGKGKSVKSCDS